MTQRISTQQTAHQYRTRIRPDARQPKPCLAHSTTMTTPHDPSLPPGVPRAPTIAIHCKPCREPRVFQHEHTNRTAAPNSAASILSTCLLCGLLIELRCTECGALYQPQFAYRTAPWLRD